MTTEKMNTPRWTQWTDFPGWAEIHSDKFWQMGSAPVRYFRYDGTGEYNGGMPARSALVEIPPSHPPMLPYPPIITDFRNRVNVEGSQAFMDANPHFPREYGDGLFHYLDDRNLPLTRANLEQACQILDLGKLTPVEESPVNKPIEIHQVVAAPAVAPPTPEEAEQLAKLADDKNLNDHQRKVRLEKLAQLARQQRRVFRDHAGISHV
jgi:hypothetical protein